MGFGIKISEEGYDVTDAPVEHTMLHSEYPNLKIKMSQTPSHFDAEIYTFTSNPSAGTINLVTIPHGLGYTPAHMVLISFDGSTYIMGTYMNTDLVNYEDRYHIYCDNTNFKIDLERVSLFGGALPNLNGTTLYYKYYIFVEEGA